MAKTKYDNYSKEQLIAKLEKLEKKGYGMVWEDKPEKIADRCEKELPVLVEDKKREIKKDPTKPTHFIFEGDNYHTLYTLNFTHKKGIDVIYIDPPYNTGKTDKNGVTDFRYNDRFIKKEDRFRHSTWLSFMNKRLRLAKNLLKDTGVIAISIDDNEVFNLKLLCDKIFGELNHIATVPTIMNLKGNQDQFGFAGTHEYTLFYGRNKLKVKLNDFDVDEKELEKWVYDDYGIYKKGANLKATGGNAPRSKRPNLYYPIFINASNELYVTENDKKLNSSDYELLPITDGNEMSWRWEKATVKKDIHNIILVGDNENYSIYKKQRPKLGDIPTKKPKSIFYKPEYSSGNGTTQLKKIFNGKKVFNNPKPLDLIKDILHVCSTKNSVILDFFAGSSTSGHAVLELNNEDGGKRQVILCTNNENNICEEVTYPRMQKVINGYNNVKGIAGNLKYFKTDYVPTVLTDNDKRNLVAKSTELLCIAENTFAKVSEDSNQDEFSIFKNDKQHTAIIYDEDYIEKCCVQLNKLDNTKEIIIYVFSYDHNYMEEDFENLKKIFKVKPIPEVILNVYRKISKLKNK